MIDLASTAYDFAPYVPGAQALTFIIVMPPYSNSAWLSNLMTGDFTACYCEPIAGDTPLAQLDELVSDRPTGICDTFIGGHPLWLNAHPARKVLVRRSAADVLKAMADALGTDIGKLPAGLLESQEIDVESRDAIRADLVVAFDDLHARLPEIWKTCTGLPFDGRRADLLTQYQIQISGQRGGVPASTSPHHFSLEVH